MVANSNAGPKGCALPGMLPAFTPIKPVGILARLALSRGLGRRKFLLGAFVKEPGGCILFLRARNNPKGNTAEVHARFP
jgi:hypothetical protein